jgi:hypothetical protein
MSSTIEGTADNGFQRAVADIKHNVEAATAAQTKASERVIKTGKEFTAFSQGLVEAYVQAGQIYANGAQELFRQMAQSSQNVFLESLNGFRAFATAKTAKERIELQATFARSSAVWAVSETSRFAHASIELAEKVAQPITAKAIVAAEALSDLNKA